MCYGSKFKIKGVNYRSPDYAFVPCGRCAECLAVYKSSWAFRISAQFSPLVEKGWKMCFYTLTYDNDHIPTLPLCVYKNPEWDYYTDMERGNSEGIICFSRDDLEKYTHHMRDWFLSCGLVDVQYFICSEFGEATQRSHYHGIYVVPPSFDTRALFDEIKSWWNTHFGFVFPRYYEGGRDDNGYEHKPFVVEEPNGAMRYIAKYVTKDLAFQEFLQDKGVSESSFYTKSREYRRCMPFHLQTRGLGRAFVDSLDDTAKLDLLKNGRSFLGDKKKRAVPRYIREKILFNPVYERSSSGRRLVRREMTDFFRANYSKIFEQKKSLVSDSLRLMMNKDDWLSRGASVSVYEKAKKIISDASVIANRYAGLSSWITAYHGQSFDKCFVPFSEDFSEYWVRRFWRGDSWSPYRLSVSERSDFRKLTSLVTSLYTIRSFYPALVSRLKREKDYRSDWWKSRASRVLLDCA